ncbi:MAG: hypothetical protein DDT20_01291 [Firmicutes bacterium]|nr:hypothetical protein [Bacillota bacterium]
MPANNGANVGYETSLWRMADALRGSMDPAEYKHVVLGLIFLKYISDAFEEQHARLVAEQPSGADPEHPDEYLAQNIFWVPTEARWAHLRTFARQPAIGQLVDDAMAAIERDNPALKGVLPKDYARPVLDKMRLGQLIDLISNIRVGDEEARARDVLAASTTPAAAPPECSSSRWNSSVPTRAATATGAGRAPISPSTARSPTTPPRTHRHRRLRPCQRRHVVEPVGRGRNPQEDDRSRPGGLHGRPAGPALLYHANSSLPLVPGPRPPRPGALHRCPQAWPDGGPHPPRVDRRRHRPHC